MLGSTRHSLVEEARAHSRKWEALEVGAALPACGTPTHCLGAMWCMTQGVTAGHSVGEGRGAKKGRNPAAQCWEWQKSNGLVLTLSWHLSWQSRSA